MNKCDREHPEAGAIWMDTKSTEKYRIYAVSEWQGKKLVIFHLADQSPTTPHVFAKAAGMSPLFWQVGSDLLHPIKEDHSCESVKLATNSSIAKTLWDTQGAHCWIMPEHEFMGFHTGPDGSHIFKFFLISETTLEPGDRVSISLPSVESEIICSVVSVEDGKVLAEFQDGDAMFQVSVERDRVRKLR